MMPKGKAWTRFGLGLSSVFDPFRCYGLDAYIPGAAKEIIELAEELVVSLMVEWAKGNPKVRVTTIEQAPEVKRKGTGRKGDNVCPECGGLMQMEEGCAKCLGCGWSKCD